MPDTDDMDLFQEFARHNSETAFAALVQRHINLVYSVALRYTANPGDAQDVTQAVFIILARKAVRLNDRTVLTGWFYETTRLTAAGWLRTQKRRQTREQEAYMQSTLEQAGADNLWRQLAPHLEAAMSRLNAKECTLLALRFYENKTGAEANALLGIREEAAHKRTARALEKLRNIFTKHGINSTTAMLTGTISANSVHAAPVGLAKTISVVAMAKGAAAGTSTLTLVKGALKIMAWTKMKTAVVVGISVLLAAGTTTVVVHESKMFRVSKTTGIDAYILAESSGHGACWQL
jgi:RNA polymerase sigma factor (sigma-70 family)